MNIPSEKLEAFLDELEAARAVVFVCSQALDHGDTDLELQSATVLANASYKLAVVHDELVSLRIDSLAVARGTRRVHRALDQLLAPKAPE